MDHANYTWALRHGYALSTCYPNEANLTCRSLQYADRTHTGCKSASHVLVGPLLGLTMLR